MKACLILAALAGSALADVFPGVHYTNGWVMSKEYIPASTAVTFTVVVKEQGIDEIKRIAKEVSDPDHKAYGQHLTAAQIAAITRPAAADMDAVTSWLSSKGMTYKLQGVSNLVVTAPVRAVEALFNTKFHVAKHAADKRALVRAGDFEIPSTLSASIATVFGLHGLPIPKTKALITDPGEPVDVTPDVILTTYTVGKQTVRRSPDNRQAVAEFQGQFMNSTDLVNMFKDYVKDYTPGVDDKVTVWHGEHQENSGGIEAELDIQYIMGVSPGIQTEFWEFPGNDFGNDLNQWTSNLTTGDDTPLVHSVSYGWQGNLSQIGVKQADVDVVNSNFAKLAAKGISIMISSGDSGSGYAPNDPCEGQPGEKGVGIDGTLIKSMTVNGYDECCEEASQSGAKGWQFSEWAAPEVITSTQITPDPAQCIAMMHKLCGSVDKHEPECRDCLHSHNIQLAPICEGTGSGQKFCPPTVTVPAPPVPKGTMKFVKAPFHAEMINPNKPIFHNRDVFELTGTITNAAGGTVKAMAMNGTMGETTMTFSPGYAPPGNPGPVVFFNISGTFNKVKLMGRGEALAFTGQDEMLLNVEWMCPGSTTELCYVWERGVNPPPPPPPPPPGTCSMYSTVTSKPAANSSTYSGTGGSSAVVLWASWPASSPWVTAVGATRFIGQKVGNDEMATDQFGSGAGFYPMFMTDHEFQDAAVAKYLSTVDPSTLPPADSYDPKARATPDVSALGEGFQVIVDGRPMSVGGTSASSPTFAGLMSLLNEARQTAGKANMGFLNPFLYKNEAAFFDVTVGSCKIGRGGQMLPYGFNASAGWDPATGLGTPHFDKLLAAAMAAVEDKAEM